MRGVRVWLSNPRWRHPCTECARLLISSEGVLQRDKEGKPLDRPEDGPTPCLSCPKVPEWAKAAGMDWKECRAAADELTEQNREALDHYMTCRAVGKFPEDPLSDWAAMLIRREEDDATAEAEKDTREGIRQLLALLYRTRR